MGTLIKKSALITLILLSLGSGISDAWPACLVEKMAGRWVYSEHGTHVLQFGAPFSEVGWFELRKDGTGFGEAFLSIGGLPIPPAGEPHTPLNAGIPLNIVEVVINPETCAGRAAFIPGGESIVRTITFVVNSKLTEFQYISTTGDLTIIGTAKKNE